MKRKFFTLITCLAMLLCSTLQSSAITMSPSMSPEEYVSQQISAIRSNDATCPWNDGTTISAMMTLYNLDDIPNGYIFNLSTDGIETGFIQIHCIENDYSLYCYAFSGDSEVQCMADFWGYDLSKTNIYFLGSFKYLILDGTDYLDLSSNSLIELDDSTLKTLENTYTSQVQSTPISITPSSTPIDTSSLIMPLGYEDDYVWPIAGDFSDLTISYNGKSQKVSKHCGPTAATGIIGCLDHLGKITIPSGDKVKDTFEKLYISLNTNNIRFNSTTVSGTAWNQVDVGIRWYGRTYGCDVSADLSNSNSLSSMKSALRNGYLLQVGVKNFDGTSGGHFIVVTACSTDTGMLYVQNGWNRNSVQYPYSSLDIVNYTYVG